MGDKFKVNPSDSLCASCKEVPQAVDNLQCFICKGLFHANCPTVNEDEKVGTKSVVNQFNRPSTKKNFKFFCDSCLTKFEVDLANDDTRRLNKVEGNITTIMSELNEIKAILKENNKKESEKQNDAGKVSSNNIWFDKKRLESTKAAPPESMLVLNDSQEVNDSVERAIIENNIAVTKSFKSVSGDLVVVCNSTESRDQLKTIIESSTENASVKPISKKKPSVTIVGLNKIYSKEEVIKLLVTQNQHIKQFSTVNDLNEHFEIHDVKPTRGNPSVFQVFASVSEVLRDGIRNFDDKVTIGLLKCKVYDRYHIKRCNNCQVLGHYYKECPTPQEPKCAKCSQNHSTDTCTVTENKCINCCKLNKPSNHSAFDPKCPCIVELIEKKKSLNSQRKTMEHK